MRLLHDHPDVWLSLKTAASIHCVQNEQLDILDDTTSQSQPPACFRSHTVSKARQVQASEDTYRLFAAASDGCLQCVRHCVEKLGVSHTAASSTKGYTALDFAEWKEQDHARNGSVILYLCGLREEQGELSPSVLHSNMRLQLGEGGCIDPAANSESTLQEAFWSGTVHCKHTGALQTMTFKLSSQSTKGPSVHRSRNLFNRVRQLPLDVQQMQQSYGIGFELLLK